MENLLIICTRNTSPRRTRTCRHSPVKWIRGRRKGHDINSSSTTSLLAFKKGSVSSLFCVTFATPHPVCQTGVVTSTYETTELRHWLTATATDDDRPLTIMISVR